MLFQTEPICVTGAAGWLGLGLVHALIHGVPGVPKLGAPGDAPIRCLVLPGENASTLQSMSPRIQIIQGDVRNPGEVETLIHGAKGGTLFHVAGIIHPRRVSEFRAINLQGTVNVLDAAMRSGVRRVVVVSSNSPCGCNPHVDHLFDEESPYNPYMGYGKSKMLMEAAVRERQATGRIETVIVRPPWFYGPFQPPRQTEFFRMIRDGKMPIVGDGRNRRSMAYIENLAQGLLLAAVEPKAAGQTYWIADDRPYEMNEIVDTVEQLLEKEFDQKCAHRRLRLPNLASGVAWMIDRGLQSAGVYHQKFHVLSEMNKTIACSVAKARHELGYDPKIALEEGMRRSIRWVVEHGGGL